MAMLILSGSIKSKSRTALSCFLFTFIFLFLQAYFYNYPSPSIEESVVGKYLDNFIDIKNSVVYFNFLAGVLLFVFRDRIPYSGKLALASIVLIAISKFVQEPFSYSLAIAYLSVYIGLLDIPKLPLYSRGDYSYGIYLYAFPIQQALISLFPGKFNVITHFLLSTALVTGVAMLSWHCIEKPVLSLRKKFSFTARKGDENESQPAPTQSVIEPAVKPVINPSQPQ